MPTLKKHVKVKSNQSFHGGAYSALLMIKENLTFRLQRKCWQSVKWHGHRHGPLRIARVCIDRTCQYTSYSNIAFFL